jgi:hypothetical protein
VAGGVFGTLAAIDHASASSDCLQGPSSTVVCNQRGYDTTRDAQQAALASTIAFAAGASVLAVGIVLHITAPPALRGGLALRLGSGLVPGGAGALLAGAF